MSTLKLPSRPVRYVANDDAAAEQSAMMRMNAAASMLGIKPQQAPANDNFMARCFEHVKPLEDALRAAWLTLQRLPRDRSLWPAGYKSSWPEPVRSVVESYGFERARLSRVLPTAQQIQQMDDRFRDLMLVNEADRAIITARMSRAPYRALADRYDCSVEHVRQRYCAALCTLAVKIGTR